MVDLRRYIDKISLTTGEVLDDPINPEELLIQSHRDYHIMDIYARAMMSYFIKQTGDEAKVIQAMKEWRRRGLKIAEALARLMSEDKPEKIARKLFGIKRREYYFRYKRPASISKAELQEIISELKIKAREQLSFLRTNRGVPYINILLTGGTGFIGKEIIYQAAQDPEINKVYVLLRPKHIQDRRTKSVIEIVEVSRRGRELLDEVWIEDPQQRNKFIFIEGDIEQSNFGLASSIINELRQEITHVIHCAASVAFDASFEDSYKANVIGSRNALEFSLLLQTCSDSPFVAHLSVETSYIHGRQMPHPAREEEVVFPRNFYNNYYELTKAIASWETENFMLTNRLRVVSLCPAIVIGESRAGNNRGDRKVVNAPVNAFGRVREHLKEARGNWIRWSKAWVLSRLATTWPGDPGAEINLIPVDRVVQGILAATKRPEAVGERIHLATDKRITAEQIRNILREELKVKVKLAEPTIHRNLQLPVLSKFLTTLGHKKMATAMEKLGKIFGGYSEWGQPVHEVGKDVEILGLSPERPDTERVFRMLCRHNKYVQEFGKVQDPLEISRREKLWLEFITELETRYGCPAGALDAKTFRDEFFQAFNPHDFTRLAAPEKIESS